VRQLSRAACHADFTYTMTLDVVKIQDTGKGAKSVAEDLEAVLPKIEYWHQGSIAGYRIGFQDLKGAWHQVEWESSQVRVDPT